MLFFANLPCKVPFLNLYSTEGVAFGMRDASVAGRVFASGFRERFIRSGDAKSAG